MRGPGDRRRTFLALTGMAGPGRERTAGEELALHLAPPLAAGLIRALRATCRLRYHGLEHVLPFWRGDRRYVHVFWHAHLLLMVYGYRGPGLAFLISRSLDGELISRTVERFGYFPVRGSSSRGSVMGMRAIFRAFREGKDVGFTPDGPRGPARVVQPGCVAAARHLGVPVVPLALGASGAWRLRSWDRFIVPRPFSRVLFAYGEPVPIPRGMSIEEGCERVREALLAVETFAADHAADPGVGVPFPGEP